MCSADNNRHDDGAVGHRVRLTGHCRHQKHIFGSCGALYSRCLGSAQTELLFLVVVIFIEGTLRDRARELRYRGRLRTQFAAAATQRRMISRDGRRGSISPQKTVG
jgi:hypothetical protein